MTKTSIGAAPQFLGSIAIALLFVSAQMHVLAQNRNSGEIRGTITDPSGATVAGARVAITNTLTGITTTVITGAGRYLRCPSA